MMRRSLIIVLLSCFALAAAAGAQTAPPPTSEDLLVHHRLFQGMDVTQVAAVLHLPAPPPPPEGYTQDQALQVRVTAAVDYFVSHGYLTDAQGIGVHLSSGEGGVYTLTIDGPGIHVVIVLPCGPFLPTATDQLISATAVRWSISNGF